MFIAFSFTIQRKQADAGKNNWFDEMYRWLDLMQEIYFFFLLFIK